MLRKATVFVAAAVLALGVGVGSSGIGGTGHAFADSNAQGTGQYPGLVAYCQYAVSQGYIVGTVGSCVSGLTSNGNSMSFAPSLCTWVATTYLGNGYGFYLYFYNPATNDVESPGPIANQGQCVSTEARYYNMGYYNFDASYTPLP